jgi:hypothetical protein
MSLASLGLDPDEGVRTQGRPDLGQQVTTLAAAKQLALMGNIRIAERDAHQEPIELRLR